MSRWESEYAGVRVGQRGMRIGIAFALLAAGLTGCDVEPGSVPSLSGSPHGGPDSSSGPPKGSVEVTAAGESPVATAAGESSFAAAPNDVLVAEARWVQREGVRALVVTPSQALRDSREKPVHEEAWRRVLASVPEADTPGMRDQFLCHAAFAFLKKGWYLEPERPAVGYPQTVFAGCNPGDVLDVG
ncbi:DUF2599 domain-containing protein [Gephyromycinifex aptenodytis]|uniref:DUF2599 domain-containing protein n=1 Tax=Gephyromycinifex aptenodytis TaxID=2716227 RepID=UPI001B2FFD55|nr:DUF2599 domain-containing protein [Gephyromycinifex aptenodytis]